MRKTKLTIVNRKIFIQGFRFIIVGISNAIIGLGLIYLCYNLLRINYKLSNIIGYSCGFINSFIWNKKWTFKSNKRALKEFFLFGFIFLISFSLNFISIIACVEKFGLTPNLAQLVGVFIYTTTNFLGNKFITFRK